MIFAGARAVEQTMGRFHVLVHEALRWACSRPAPMDGRVPDAGDGLPGAPGVEPPVADPLREAAALDVLGEHVGTPPTTRT